MSLEYKIVNVVATCDLGVRINLANYARTNVASVQYNPDVFRAAITRLKDPSSTILVFHTGRLVITGAKTCDTARSQADRMKRLLKIRKAPMSFKVQNIVTTASCHKSINLVALYAQIVTHAQDKIKSVTYEVEIFSGLQIKLNQGCIIVFSSGKIIVTGFTSRSLINECYDEISSFLTQYGSSFIRASSIGI
uniref:TATA-box-binding protein n=1 Tax=Panagrellus redivivus TaxID=6233 RepID=A0A7E4VFR1_PANRE